MIKPKYDNVIWSIPTLFGEDVLCFSLLNILDKYNIKYNFEVYGSPLCEWNESINGCLKTEDIDFIERLLNNFKFRNANPVLTFDKYDISWFSLSDKFSNNILKECCKNQCNVTVASQKLFKHIRKKYPEIGCIASQVNTINRFKKDIQKNTYKPEKELKYYNDLLKLYDRVIIRPDFVKNPLIKEINDLSKIEIIVNYSCVYNCKYSMECISSNSSDFNCSKDYIHTDDLKPDLFLSFNEIEDLINLGVKHFRILPDSKGNMNMLLMSLINFIFEQNSLNSQLFNLVIKNLEEVKYFYSEEIIRNSKIQNLSFKRV